MKHLGKKSILVSSYYLVSFFSPELYLCEKDPITTGNKFVPFMFMVLKIIHLRHEKGLKR